ncbi:sensor histidine kinase [Agrobacterium vitis]|uniref:sensor histidine kinase n=1 Tax=Allorhizobium ampelinum TaxID=3025782 RepID=UPI001F251B0F|nr:sensor histidine kinase [Allorhizobium ampelinum]
MTLSQRLFLRILPTLIITIALVGAFAYRSADREIENIYDAELINDANTLWVLLNHPLAKNSDKPIVQIPDLDFNMDDQLSLNEDADDYADAHAFRAWKNGRLVMVSSNSFPESVPEFKRGFSNFKLNGETWRVYTLPIPNSPVTIEVAEKMALRDGLVANIILNLSFPLMILVPAIAIVVWFVIHNGLNHIRVLVRQIRSRTPDDLSAISTDGLPRDLIPLVGSLNQFMEKLRISLTLERRFADLAAHQLRTPQAGIKLLLQLIERSDSEEERQALMKDLTASNERAMHLIEQMLNLARVSHQPLNLQQTNLFDLVAKVLADFGPVFNERRLQVELSGDEEALVATDSSLLRMMIDNIVDNAIKYSPDAGAIEVVITSKEDCWCVSVNDSGPGIPVQHRDKVFQQFYRLPTTEREGTGLGLAIAAAIAGRLSVDIELGVPDWGYGLRMDLLVPAGTFTAA